MDTYDQYFNLFNTVKDKNYSAFPHLLVVWFLNSAFNCDPNNIDPVRQYKTF